jgi:hypothetical protein
MPTVTKPRPTSGEAARCEGNPDRLLYRLNRTVEMLNWCVRSGLPALDERFSDNRTVAQLRGDAVELAAALAVALDRE